MSPSNQVYSAFSFIALILSLIPLPWHLEAWNTGTVIYMGWNSVALLIGFVNSVVWNDNIKLVTPVWCDIATKFMIGASIGVPAASLCINRRLYAISRADSVPLTRKDKHRQMIIDACIGILIPVICMPLHHIVQGHRFDIYEDLGCIPSTYNVTLTYVLIQPPKLILPIISCVFAALSIRNFVKRDVEFKSLLSGASISSTLGKSDGSAGSNANLTGSRYLRLMTFASMDIIFGFPTALAACIINITVLGPVHPWISWEETHFDFWGVERITAARWRSNLTITVLLEWARWMPVVCGLIFFAFFGFSYEAKKTYRAVWAVVKRYGPGVGKTFEAFSGKRESFGNMKLHSTTSSFNATGSSFARFNIKTPGTGGNSSHVALPIYVEKEVVNKRDSFDTFTSADLVSLRSGTGSTTMKLSSFAEPMKQHTPTHSASHSRSPSPTRPRPRIEVTSEISPEDTERHVAQMGLRTPESAFPRPVTPDSVYSARPASQASHSFLEMITPASPSPLTRIEAPRAALRRGDNWV